MMKKTSRWLPACLLAVVLPVAALAATLADGVAALNGKQYADALSILTPLANAGDDEAQRLLGEMIYNGQGVVQNPAAAAVWTRLAAENGNRIAQYNMGYLHERGAGVPQSINDAVAWYARAGQQQYVAAQRRLGELYEPSDIRQAHYWFDQARRNGDEGALARYLALSRQIEAIDAPKREAERLAKQAEADAEAAAERRAERAERRAQEARQANRKSLAQSVDEALAQSRGSNARIASIHNQMVRDMQPPARKPQPRPQESRRDAGNGAEERRTQQASDAAGGAASRVDEAEARRQSEAEHEAAEQAKAKRLAEERAERERLAAERKAAEEAERQARKDAEARASREYLNQITSGTRLRARTCPGQGYYVVGIRPDIKPRVHGCIDVDFRANCRSTPNASVRGTIRNFVGISTDCYMGDAVQIEKLACDAQEVVIETLETRVCSFGK